MKRILIKILKGLGILLLFLYLGICALFYFFQEEYYVFLPQALAADYQYDFEGNYEELNIAAQDGSRINTLYFKAEQSKGLIFYVRGNGGNLSNWGGVASYYTQLGYDVMIMDYRGIGKSEGSLSNERQVHEDIQAVYEVAKAEYAEDQIIVLGYSLGTGFAARLAAQNQPRLLILLAPYYSLPDASQHLIQTADAALFKVLQVVPTGWLLKYKLETHEFLKDCTAPVLIFHGDEDEVIYYGSSLKLQEQFKPGDTLITLEGESHRSVQQSPVFKTILEKRLAP